jgi:hypothetical protein
MMVMEGEAATEISLIVCARELAKLNPEGQRSEFLAKALTI